jgi:hypothetical protein
VSTDQKVKGSTPFGRAQLRGAFRDGGGALRIPLGDGFKAARPVAARTGEFAVDGGGIVAMSLRRGTYRPQTTRPRPPVDGGRSMHQKIRSTAATPIDTFDGSSITFTTVERRRPPRSPRRVDVTRLGGALI